MIMMFLVGRWMALKRDPAGYTPWGSGPHICLGMGLAIAELRATLAMLARDGRRWEQVRGMEGVGLSGSQAWWGCGLRWPCWRATGGAGSRCGGV